MRIGITFDLKTDVPAVMGQPDDFQEEFDSPVTIEAIASVLRGLGHEVIKMGDGRELMEQLLADPPDFIFNLAEGQGIGRSREARVPAVLEMLDIPYTGSDPLTLAVTLDKDCAKRLVASHGVKVPRGRLIQPDEDLSSLLKRADLVFPAIVKPAWEGSSKGIRAKCLVDHLDQLAGVVESLRRDHRQPILLEEYIEGDEITVGILGNEPPYTIATMRVVPQHQTDCFVYSLEVKRDYLRQVRYECPAGLPPATTKALEEAALKSFLALGCRDVARVDFRIRDGVPYFLEVNPLPGVNPESSDLVLMFKGYKWTYARLITAIFEAATKRQIQDRRADTARSPIFV